MALNEQEMEVMLAQAEQLFLPHISIDTVVFGYEDSQLCVLLLQVTDEKWMLPGGYIGKEEDVDDAAARILKERIALENMFLKQFHTFGASQRSFSKEIPKLFADLGVKIGADHWILQRFISVGYYALVHIPDTKPKAGLFAKGFQWAPVHTLPELLFDHTNIVNKAYAELKKAISQHPVAFHLLPTEFTMPELHRLFETILERKMDRSRFQKKMFTYQVFERLHERREGGAHRRPFLYTYKNEHL